MSDALLNKLEQLVHIGTVATPPGEVWSRLAENYRTHGWPEDAPTYAFAPAPGESEAGRALSTEFLLFQLAHMDMTLALDIIPSSLPLVGPLVDALKRPLHQLALFYVNKIAAQSATASLLQASLVQQLLRELEESRSGQEEQNK